MKKKAGLQEKEKAIVEFGNWLKRGTAALLE
jgi:hypothetical protein